MYTNAGNIFSKTIIETLHLYRIYWQINTYISFLIKLNCFLTKVVNFKIDILITIDILKYIIYINILIIYYINYIKFILLY